MNDNIIKFPKKFRGKKVPKIVNVDPSRIAEDLDFCDNLTEGLTVTMIHNLGENGIDVKSKKFIGDMSFVNEVIRGMLYRDVGYKHPIQDFIDDIVETQINKDNTIVTKVDLNLLQGVTKSDNDKEDDTS